MVLHSQLYKKLYKFTHEYKKKESKRIVNRFMFKESSNINQPSVNNTDGLNIIDSNILYRMSDFKVVKDSEISINNYSSPGGRYLNKKIKITNIPLKELYFKSKLDKLLNAYLVNSIYIENGEYKSNLEYINYRKSSIKNIDLKYIKEHSSIITKYLYGIQFNSIEFMEATGMLFTITRDFIKIDENVNEIIEGKFSNFELLQDGKNIRISLLSNSYIELEFIDTSQYINTISGVNSDVTYKIISYNNVKNITTDIAYLFSYENNEINNYVNYSKNDLYNGLYIMSNSDINNHEKIIFDNNIDKIIIDSDNYSYNQNRTILTIDIDSNINNPLFVQEVCNNSNKFINHTLIEDIDYEIIYSIDKNKLIIKKSDITENLFTDRNNVSNICIINYNYSSDNSDDIYELHDIIPNTEFFKETGNIDVDENNIISCLPFSLQKILENKSTIRYKILDKILTKNIVYWNKVPCIKFTFNSKHDNIMLFRGTKLIIPDFIYRSNSEYNIYINTTNMRFKLNNNIFTAIQILSDSSNNLDDISEIIYSDDPIYVVFDTDRHFIEDMRYDVRSIYKYIDLSNVMRYSINENNDGYIEDENGQYIKYNNYYLELSNENYIFIDNTYRPVPIGWEGKIYNKIKTNEYLLPINKDIDIDKIVISIEDDKTYPENIQTHYIRDPEGAYVYISDYKYYTIVANNELDKLGLYIYINNEYILYDPIIYHDYNGKFYKKLTEGYHIPPYYYIEDIRYRKLGRKCVKLSNVLNIRKTSAIIAKDTYDTEYIYNNIGSNPQDKIGLYIFINGEYIKYNPSLDTHISYTGDFFARQTKLIEGKTYTKNELLNKIIKDKYGSFSKEFVYYKKSENEMVLCNINTPAFTYIKISNPQDKIGLYIFINGEYIKYNPSLDTHVSYTGDFFARIDTNKYYYTPEHGDTGFTSTLEINSTIKEINEFLDKNIVYKFILDGGEILDGGYADTDEYSNIIDFGTDLSFTDYSDEESLTKEEAIEEYNNGENIFIVIDDELSLYDPINYPDYDGPFFNSSYFDTDFGIDKNENYRNDELYLDDDYDIYDFNFSSPYSIPDDSIKAYRIDSSYNNYFINNDDEYLAYKIPNQLINSENKLLTFLNGKFTDEYEINKHLYSRLFGGDSIISLTYDPEDIDNDEGYHIDPNGNVYLNYNKETNKYEYIYDPNRDKSLIDRKDTTLYYKVDPEKRVLEIDYIPCYEYDKYEIESRKRYIKFPDEYVSVPDSYIPEEGEILYYRLRNGNYIDTESYIRPIDISEIGCEVLDFTKYFELSKIYEDSFFISVDDYYLYTTSYSKNISSVYMTNMKNLCIYQNQNGITYEKGIFTLSNKIDGVVKNERQIYKDFYFIPISTKYMLFFINGRFANNGIKIISPTTFTLTDEFVRELSSENELIISQIHIYTYDKFLYNLSQYKQYFIKENVFLEDSYTHSSVILDYQKVKQEYVDENPGSDYYIIDNNDQYIKTINQEILSDNTIQKYTISYSNESDYLDISQEYVDENPGSDYYIMDNNEYIRTTNQEILSDNTIQKYVKVVVDYSIYKYNDTLWNDHNEYLKSIYEKTKFDGDIDVIYEPKAHTFSPITDLISLYEIFGKYILNKYDIDSDMTLYDEIHEYFSLLFDKNNRMKLELMLDSTKRKFIY